MSYNHHVHNRRSIRLREYDYSQAGIYFITIVTFGRHHLFGDIENNTMNLNECGIIALDEWYNTEKLRKNVSLAEMVIMPNHIHGIIVIKDNETNLENKSRTTKEKPLISSPSQTLGSIVRGYKAAVTKQINCIRGAFDTVWQRNYYEHIVRDEKSYHFISNYIVNNPINWKDDSLNK